MTPSANEASCLDTIVVMTPAKWMKKSSVRTNRDLTGVRVYGCNDDRVRLFNRKAVEGLVRTVEITL